MRLLVLSNSLYRLNLNAEESLAVIEEPRAGERVLIFAPHEDDETLGCAGFIQQAVAAGAHVRVALMTNGEYPEISVVLFEETLPLHPSAFIKLGYMRQGETLHAMRILGVPGDAVTFLGYPNGYLNQMWSPAHWLPSMPVQSIRTRTTASPYGNSMTPQAIYCGQSFLDDVKTLLMRVQPDIIITIQPNDQHVDHWPTYTAVRFALEELAAENVPFTRQARVYTYLIHRSQWPAPRGYWPALNLEPPAALYHLGVTRWEALPLTLSQTLEKVKAIRCYRTQGGRFDRLLLSFARANELFGVMPLGTWPSMAISPPLEIIDDPAADITTSLATPAGDITGVRLARQGNAMTVAVQTRGPASRKTGYHFTLHAGGMQMADRLIAEYDWQGASATGLVVRNGVLRRIDEGALHVRLSGTTATLVVPWPLNDPTTSFFLARAWTTRDAATVDQTATSTLLMARSSFLQP